MGEIDTMTLRLTWHGPPKGQPRAKATRRGAFVRMYTPDTADEMKDGIRRLAVEAMARGEWEHTTGPVDVVITAYFTRPSSHYRRVRGSDVLKQGAPVFHTRKPDVDNVAKAVMDALGSHGSWPGVWDDDKQVAALAVEKFYARDADGSWGPRVEVEIMSL